jgi:hypothetical protein
MDKRSRNRMNGRHRPNLTKTIDARDRAYTTDDVDEMAQLAVEA